MSHNQANAKNAIRNPRQILLALKSAQITNKYKNLTPHLSNQLPFHSAGTSKMDIPRSTANSVGEQLRTVSQINEPRSNNFTASQPPGIQDDTASQAFVHPRLFSTVIEAEMSSPEEGEILQ